MIMFTFTNPYSCCHVHAFPWTLISVIGIEIRVTASSLSLGTSASTTYCWNRWWHTSCLTWLIFLNLWQSWHTSRLRCRWLLSSWRSGRWCDILVTPIQVIRLQRSCKRLVCRPSSMTNQSYSSSWRPAHPSHTYVPCPGEDGRKAALQWEID